jgi:hypothetical protein
MFARSDTYFRLHLIITTTCISLSLRQTSAPIHLTSVLGVLKTQETFCIVIAGLLDRDSFDLLLPEFDKPWVIHLRETYCCSTNLCTWRPNTVYKNRRVCRHHREELLDPPDLGSTTARLAVCFMEKCLGLRVFTRKKIYRRKGGVRGGPRGPHHLVARPGSGLRHPMVQPPPGPPPSLLWTPSLCQVNRYFGFRFIQF